VIRPGDVILADDDGVVAIPRERAAEAAEKSRLREDKEAATRAAFLEGQLGLDRYGLRDTLAELGVRYQTYEQYTEAGS
jgi:4-hydroxy-4-methyl-2-oxoglutarate aldolase